MVKHRHLLVRAEVERPFVGPAITKAWLRELVKAIGMVITETGGPYADYVEKADNFGIAAFAMIETSHCALHVWDRLSPPLAQLDVYSCSEFDPAVVVRMLDDAMTITKVECGLVNRADGLEMLTMIPDDWYKIKNA